MKFIIGCSLFVVIMGQVCASESATRSKDRVQNFWEALTVNDINCVKAFIYTDRSLATETNGGKTTPLMFVASRGFLEIAQFLVAKGADVNARGEFGSTAL